MAETQEFRGLCDKGIAVLVDKCRRDKGYEVQER